MSEIVVDRQRGERLVERQHGRGGGARRGGGPLWSGLGALLATGHQGLVAAHAEDALRGPRVFEVLDLALAVAASEAAGAEGLVAGEDG